MSREGTGRKLTIQEVWTDNKSLKQSVLFTVLAYVICHGTALANVFYTHDSLFSLYKWDNWDFFLRLGRFSQWPVKYFLFGDVETNWMHSLLGMAFLILSVYLLARIFQFSGVQILITVLVLCTNISIINLVATYCSAITLYMSAIFSYTLCIFCEEKIANRTASFAAGVLLLAFSLGAYPAYIGWAAGLFLILMIRRCLEENLTFRKYFLMGIRYFAILVFGMALYLVLMKLTIRLAGLEAAGGYNGPDSLGNVTRETILQAVPSVYKRVWDTFFTRSGYLRGSLILIDILVLGIGVLFLAICLLRKKSVKSLIQVMLPLPLIPLAVGVIELVSLGTMHQLMIYPYFLLYLLPLIFYKALQKQEGGSLPGSFMGRITVYGGIILTVCFLFYGLTNANYANGFYVINKFKYDKAVSCMSDILNDIKADPSYRPDTPVSFVGYGQGSAFSYDSTITERYEDQTAYYSAAITNDYNLANFIRKVMGEESMQININDPALVGDPYVQEMPVYPRDGYLQNYQGRLVVKLSNQ